ncbi:MAG: hypothetical protein AAB535_03065 [Patescibacteria group bacterium]
MQEKYDQEEARIKAIQARSGLDGTTQPPASGYDQVNMEMATPTLIQNMARVGGLTEKEASKLLKLAGEVAKEIAVRFDMG